MTETLKEQATLLRQQGLTYPQISEQTGLSIDWCKKNLKKVEVEDVLLKELVALATRPEGCTSYEASALIYSHKKGVPVTKEECKNIKDKAKRRDKGCVYRPAWMDTEYPIESNWQLNSLAVDLSDRLTEYTNEYVRQYPSTSSKMVFKELIHLASGFTSPEGVQTRLKRNEETSQRIACRVAGDQEGLDLVNWAPPTPSKADSADYTKPKSEVLTDEELDALLL